MFPRLLVLTSLLLIAYVSPVPPGAAPARCPVRCGGDVPFLPPIVGVTKMRHSARHQGGQSLFAAGDHDDTDTFHKKVKMKNTFMNQSHKHSFPLIALCMMAVVSIALAVPPPMGVEAAMKMVEGTARSMGIEVA